MKRTTTLLILLIYQSQLFAQCLSGNCQNGQGEKAYPDGSRFKGIFQNGSKKLGFISIPMEMSIKEAFSKTKGMELQITPMPMETNSKVNI
jgi:hypothetical protein